MKQLESKLQIACVRWFDLTYPKLKMNLFSIPNEGSRTPANGARMKAQGRRAGCADIFLAVDKTDFLECHNAIFKHDVIRYNGLFIEFKADKGKQNENQLAFQKAVESQGYAYVVIRSFDEFKELIEDYLG
jgi:hypothetical protein